MFISSDLTNIYVLESISSRTYFSSILCLWNHTPPLLSLLQHANWNDIWSRTAPFHNDYPLETWLFRWYRSFPSSKLTIFQHRLDNGLAASKPLSEPIMVSFLCIFASLGLNELTHWDLKRTTNTLQTTFSNVFSRMMIYAFRLYVGEVCC